MIAVPAQSVAHRPAAAPERVFRRLRRIVRRRVRVDVHVLRGTPITAGDGTLSVRVRSGLEPGSVAWEADRPVELVVLYTGCGVRLAGAGGLDGELVLPPVPCADAYLAFCYDAPVESSIPA